MRVYKLILTFSLSLLLLISVTSCGKSNSNISGLGTPAETELVSVTINSISASHGGGSTFDQPEEGNIFLVLDISVVNTSSEDVAVHTMQIGEGKVVWFSIFATW